MKDTKKYYDYIDKLINDTPDFMMINDDESYVLLCLLYTSPSPRD